MPAYNFQGRFVEGILDGSKGQTIRRRRKRPTVSGDVLKLYTGMRTKSCRLLRVADCTSVVPVQVLRGTGVILNGRVLSDVETVLFAERDGFGNASEFFDFFDRYSFETLDKELEVIYWRRDPLPSPPPNIPLGYLGEGGKAFDERRY